MEPMLHSRVSHSTNRVVDLLRRAAAAAFAVVGLIVTFAIAVVIALAGVSIALIVAGGLGVMWLLARITRPRRGHDVRTLEARKGPHGWTVETRRYSF
jgi:hypothetical protein